MIKNFVNISENEKIQKVLSSKIYKRMFVSFLILAGLLTVIGKAKQKKRKEKDEFCILIINIIQFLLGKFTQKKEGIL